MSSKCFSVLCLVWSIRWWVSREVLQSVTCHGAGFLKGWIWRCDFHRPPETTTGQAAIRAKRRCMADLFSLFAGPHPASLHSLHWSSSMIDFVPVGGAAVSLRPQLCSQLSSISVFLTREDVSTRCNTDCACYHRWPHLPGSCCVWNSLLETVCACCLTASSFPQ